MREANGLPTIANTSISIRILPLHLHIGSSQRQELQREREHIVSEELEATRNVQSSLHISQEPELANEGNSIRFTTSETVQETREECISIAKQMDSKSI